MLTMYTNNASVVAKLKMKVLFYVAEFLQIRLIAEKNNKRDL